MSEDLKGLIEKIHEEGVKAAEEKAQKIIEDATHRAKNIIEKAEREARAILDQAKDATAKMEENAKASLAQARRDVLLSLKQEIGTLLDRVIIEHARETLSPQELASILTSLVSKASREEKGEIIITLNAKDLEKLERGFLSALKDEVKKGITLKPSDDIHAGFIISYDSGKSHFDFTDKGLAEYLGSYLKPKLAEILNQATP